MVVGEFTLEADVVIIGGGPGGYRAALRAAEIGVQPVIIDQRPALGGTWLHDGCYLSKELAHLASTIRSAAGARYVGVRFDPPHIDLKQLGDSVQTAIRESAANLRSMCETCGVRIIEGKARFENSRQLSIVGNNEVPRIRFRRAIVATGSVAQIPEAMQSDDPRVMTPAQALQLSNVPESMLIVGGSTAALEYASAFASFGSHVTIAHERADLLPMVDRDLAEYAVAHLMDSCDQIYTNVATRSLNATSRGIEATFEGDTSPSRTTFDAALIAAGRRPCTESLDLARTQVTIGESGFIETDSSMRTADPRILAVGDVTGEPMLVLKAAQQGRIAAEVAAGWNSEFDARAMPNVYFLDPPIAWCGLTEEDAIAADIPHEIQRSQWAAAQQAASLSRSAGTTKIVYDPDTKLVLGVGIVGAGATELIAEAVLAVEMGAELADLAAVIHANPSTGRSLAATARQAESESERR